MNNQRGKPLSPAAAAVAAGATIFSHLQLPLPILKPDTATNIFITRFTVSALSCLIFVPGAKCRELPRNSSVSDASSDSRNRSFRPDSEQHFPLNELRLRRLTTGKKFSGSENFYTCVIHLQCVCVCVCTWSRH